MIKIDLEFKKRIIDAMLMDRQSFGGSESAYSKMIGINASVFSQLKNNKIEGQLSDHKWIDLARRYNVGQQKSDWKVARTSVYKQIESNLKFCKEYSKSMILVDDCGIGKTFCARHIIKNMKNAFYFDCSQAKTYTEFVRKLARTIGLDPAGRLSELKSNIMYTLNNIYGNPIICLDEAGDLNYRSLMELKSFWNGTEGQCAWYMMGAQGLQRKIQMGMNRETVGYAELFSRFSDGFVKVVPFGRDNKQKFYTQLIGDVAHANLPPKQHGKINDMVKKCIAKNATLRHAETLIDLAKI